MPATDAKGYDWGGFLVTDPLNEQPPLSPSAFGKQLLAVDDASGALTLLGISALAIPDPTGQGGNFLTTDGVNLSWSPAAGGGGGTWGSITGTLSSQSDLNTALGNKQPLDSDLTAIAALTTTSFGRSFLDRADAAAGRTLLGLSTLSTTTPASGVATFLATPSSANLRAALTDGNGTGAVLFNNATSPLFNNTFTVQDGNAQFYIDVTSPTNDSIQFDLYGAGGQQAFQVTGRGQVLLADGDAIGGHYLLLNPPSITVNRTMSWADASGTLALTTNSTGVVDLTHGGTNATTVAAARTNLGATTVGAAMFGLTNPGAITFPRFNADNSVTALSASAFRTAIGAGTSSFSGLFTGLDFTASNLTSIATRNFSDLQNKPAMLTTAYQTFSNADVTLSSASRIVAQTGTLSAVRQVTLPSAASAGAGAVIVIYDASRTTNFRANKYIKAIRAGSDTINGTTFDYIGASSNSSGALWLVSDGVSNWQRLDTLARDSYTELVSAFEGFQVIGTDGNGTAGLDPTQIYSGGSLQLGGLSLSIDDPQIVMRKDDATASATIQIDLLSAARTFHFPNASGTFMLTSAIGSTVQAYDADLTTWSGITPGTGVGTALGVNVGSAGAFVTNGGALGTPTSGTLTNCSFPTLNQNTTGSAASLSVSGQTGLFTVTGLTSTNRAKTVRDAADTILELGGSYTPTGAWTSLPLTTPKVTTAIQDANANSMLAFTATASAVDGFTFTNAATANPATVTMAATGSDSNIKLALTPKGAAGVVVNEQVGGSGLTVTGATQTTSQPVINATQTWNASGVTFTGLKLNITNTASATSSLLADFQIAGSSFAQIDKSNRIGAGSFSSEGYKVYWPGGGAGGAVNGITAVSNQLKGSWVWNYLMLGSAQIGFAADSSTAGLSSSADAGISRNGAGIVEVNTGTLGQWGALKAGVRDSGTTTVTNGLTVGHQSTGTPAAGLGSAVLFNIDSSTTADQNAVQLSALWTTATHASRTADFVVKNVNSAAALAETFRVTAAGNVSQVGKTTTYNNIATVSNGIPSEVATIDSTGLTANVAASTLYSVPASGAGLYRVSAYLVTTTAASVSSTMPNAQVVYTDSDSNTSVTLDVSPILGAAGLGQSGLLTANAVGTVFSGTVVIYAKLSTTIQYQTVNYASTAGGMAYALRMKLEAL